MNSDSTHYQAYFDHILGRQKATGAIAKVYNLIADITDRRDIKHVWNRFDTDVQDSIIEDWVKIIEG